MGRPHRYALVDPGVFAPIQHCPHLGAEAGFGQRYPDGRGQLAIEPGRGVARDLPIEIIDRESGPARSPRLRLVIGCGEP